MHLLIFHKYFLREVIGKFLVIQDTRPNLCRLIKVEYVFLCTFDCSLRKSLYYSHTFSVHTLAKIDLVRFRNRSSIRSATYSLGYPLLFSQSP